MNMLSDPAPDSGRRDEFASINNSKISEHEIGAEEDAADA